MAHISLRFCKGISRDRADVVAEGARQGAPQATQGADRWHLLRNLADALESWRSRERNVLEHALEGSSPMNEASRSEGFPESAGAMSAGMSVEETEPSRAISVIGSLGTVGLGAPNDSPREVVGSLAGEAGETRAERKALESRERRMKRFDQVRHLHTHGLRISEIARILRLSRGTVRKFVEAETFPERRPRSPQRGRLLDPHRPYLAERSGQGCHNARQLFQEVRGRGYPGGYTAVSDEMRRLRKERQGELAPEEKQPGLEIRARDLVTALLKHARIEEPSLDRSDDPREIPPSLLGRLRETSEPFRVVSDLTQQFTTMLRERKGEKLCEWVKAAVDCGVREIAGFAAGLKRDWDAVQAGLTVSWSNGPMEGFSNRLKEIKWRIYGRANFDLLLRMVLQPP